MAWRTRSVLKLIYQEIILSQQETFKFSHLFSKHSQEITLGDFITVKNFGVMSSVTAYSIFSFNFAVTFRPGFDRAQRSPRLDGSLRLSRRLIKESRYQIFFTKHCYICKSNWRSSAREDFENAIEDSRARRNLFPQNRVGVGRRNVLVWN